MPVTRADSSGRGARPRAVRAVLVLALVATSCSKVFPAPPLQGDDVRYRTIGRVGQLEVVAASNGTRQQIDLLCHDSPTPNVFHASVTRLTRMIALLDELLVGEPPAPGESYQAGEVMMPLFRAQTAPRLTFGTATPATPGAETVFEVDCYDAFIENTQHFDFTREEAETLRGLLADARGWLRPPES